MPILFSGHPHNRIAPQQVTRPNFFSRLYRRVLVRSLSWLLSRFGLVALRTKDYNAAKSAAFIALDFTQHSGFLRDGRYPGGRHAERTLRDTLTSLVRVREWRDDG